MIEDTGLLFGAKRGVTLYVCISVQYVCVLCLVGKARSLGEQRPSSSLSDLYKMLIFVMSGWKTNFCSSYNQSKLNTLRD